MWKGNERPAILLAGGEAAVVAALNQSHSQLTSRHALLKPRRQFFASGKTLPVVRGGGLDQPVMRVVASEVAAGRWLHVFPEGKINFTGALGPLRWGVGKIVCDAVGASGR